MVEYLCNIKKCAQFVQLLIFKCGYVCISWNGISWDGAGKNITDPRFPGSVGKCYSAHPEIIAGVGRRHSRIPELIPAKWHNLTIVPAKRIYCITSVESVESLHNRSSVHVKIQQNPITQSRPWGAFLVFLIWAATPLLSCWAASNVVIDLNNVCSFYWQLRAFMLSAQQVRIYTLWRTGNVFDILHNPVAGCCWLLLIFINTSTFW